MIVVLWRADLRISEALALAESDLDPMVARFSYDAGYAEFGMRSIKFADRVNVPPVLAIIVVAM